MSMKEFLRLKGWESIDLEGDNALMAISVTVPSIRKRIPHESAVATRLWAKAMLGMAPGIFLAP